MDGSEDSTFGIAKRLLLSEAQEASLQRRAIADRSRALIAVSLLLAGTIFTILEPVEGVKVRFGLYTLLAIGAAALFIWYRVGTFARDMENQSYDLLFEVQRQGGREGSYDEVIDKKLITHRGRRTQNAIRIDAAERIAYALLFCLELTIFTLF